MSLDLLDHQQKLINLLGLGHFRIARLTIKCAPEKFTVVEVYEMQDDGEITGPRYYEIIPAGRSQVVGIDGVVRVMPVVNQVEKQVFEALELSG